MRFRATAYNDKGQTFLFFFTNFNWYKIQSVADEALAQWVATDSFYQKHGPWKAHRIDVSG